MGTKLSNYFLPIIFSTLLFSIDLYGQTEEDPSLSDINIAGMDSEIVEYPFSSTIKREVTTPVTVISGEELRTYPSTSLLEALTGKIPSAQFITSNTSPGNTRINMTIRGQRYHVVVDGISRSLDEVSVYEVESVTILKGLVARAAYGYNANSGLIIVKTKSGDMGKASVKADVEFGTRMVNQNRIPGWLNSFEYASLYNKACLNDGIPEKYSQSDLEGYQSENNPLRYPDVNLYEELFNNSMNFQRTNLQYTGGNQVARYLINVNYMGEGKGAYKFKDASYDRVGIRSNLDLEITDEISINVGVVGRFGKSKFPKNIDSYWETIESYPPNAYPVNILPDTFGTSSTYPLNPVADIQKMDYSESFDKEAQTNFKIDMDLGRILQGLKLDVYFSYDIFNYQRLTRLNGLQYPLFEPQWQKNNAGQESMVLLQYGKNVPDAGTARTADSYNAQIGGKSSLSYSRRLNEHEFSSIFTYYLQNQQVKSVVQNFKKQDLSLYGKYGFKDKYYLEGVLSYTGCINLPAENRFGFYPSFGLGWIISEEGFLQDQSYLDFLKIRASYGMMGSYDASGSLLYRTEWQRGSSQLFGIPSQNESLWTVNLLHLGNPGIDWAVMKELNIGTDAQLMNNRLLLQLDYYRINKENFLMEALIPAAMGSLGYYENIGENEFTGMEGMVRFSDKFSDLGYDIGLNAAFNTSRILKDNRPDYPYDWMNRIGDPTDGIYGLEALGLFADENDISQSPFQTFGEVAPGNIKYNDLNGDELIDGAVDSKMIGHSNARVNYGIDLALKYRGFGLYIMGYGLLDKDALVRTNNYFYSSSIHKYSEYVLDNHWEPGREDASHPRMTTLTSTNDNRNSSYWIRDVSFFKLKNLEVSYLLSDELVKRFFASHMKLFLRATNLLTLSPVKELDPEDLTMGISKYPSTWTVTAGFSVHF